MSEEVCKQAHNYGSSIQSGMFCAGITDNMIDACDGDSGGPFSCQENGENGMRRPMIVKEETYIFVI